MKAIFLILIIAAGGAAYANWEQIRSLFEPYISRVIPQQILPGGKPEVTITTFYKWQDAVGEWHFTTTPPKDGINYQVLKFRSDENVLPPVPGTENPQPESKVNQSKGIPSILSYLPKAVSRAKGVEKTLQERKKKMDRVTGELK